jgi:hypothetical protein
MSSLARYIVDAVVPARRPQPHRPGPRPQPKELTEAGHDAGPQTIAYHLRGRLDSLDSYGKVTVRYLGRLRHIPVRAVHKNRKVRLLVARS